MLVKLSALALCVSFVSALQLHVPGRVRADSDVWIHVTSDHSDPKKVGLQLLGRASSPVLDESVDVARIITVHIPKVIPGSDYVIAACHPGDITRAIAESNPFTIYD